MFLTKTEVNYKMMPLAPTSTALMASKPKIGFSIDSIVGDRDAKITNNYSPNSEDSNERRSSPFSDYYGNDLRMRIQRERERDGSPQEPQYLRRQPDYHSDQLRTSVNLHNESTKKVSNIRMSSQNSPSTPNQVFKQQTSTTEMMSKAISSHDKETPPPSAKSPATRSRSPSPIGGQRPILVPGIPANLVRPFAVAAPSVLNPEVKPIPSYLNSPEMVTTHPNPHFLAAQFQMAAALAHGQAGQGYPPGAGIPHHHPSLPPRDGYPLYPWLLSRHGRIFPHRFPGSK